MDNFIKNILGGKRAASGSLTLILLRRTKALRIPAAYFLLCSILPLAAQTQLQDLWQSALEHSLDTSLASYKAQIADIQYKGSMSAYIPRLSLNSAVQITEAFKIYDKIPDTVQGGLNIEFPLPGAASLQTLFRYERIRSVYDDGYGIAEKPKMQVVFKQSLFPFWVQGGLSDPLRNQYRLKAMLHDVRFLQAVQKTLIKVTELYLSARRLERNLNLQGQVITHQLSLLKSLKSLQVQGLVSFQKITEAEKKRYEAELLLLEHKRTKLNLEIQFLAYCGKTPELEQEDLPIPINLSLPKLHQNLNGNKDLQIFALQVQSLQTAQILRKQNTAPVFSLHFEGLWNITEKNRKSSYTQNNFTWNLGLSVDFSPLLAEAGEKKHQRENIDHLVLGKKIDAEKQRSQKEKTEIHERVQTLTAQVESLRSLVHDIEILYDEAKKITEQGKLSPAELSELMLDVQTRRKNLADTEDDLWLYQFLLSILTGN